MQTTDWSASVLACNSQGSGLGKASEDACAPVRVAVGQISTDKPRPIFQRSDKCFDHFRLDKVAVEGIQFCQPELIAVVVVVGGVGWVTPQISEILHEDKGRPEFDGPQ